MRSSKVSGKKINSIFSLRLQFFTFLCQNEFWQRVNWFNVSDFPSKFKNQNWANFQIDCAEGYVRDVYDDKIAYRHHYTHKQSENKNQNLENS